MSGPWLVSYLALWAVVVALSLLLVGVLTQVGTWDHARSRAAESEDGIGRSLEEDGPAIRSRIPVIAAETANGFGELSTVAPRSRRQLLLLFLAPMCDSCQRLEGLVNDLVRDDSRGVQPIVIVRGDNHLCEAFLSLFPMRAPVICDGAGEITMRLDIHRIPLGLLYDEHDMLVRKGVITNENSLRALLGEVSPASPTEAEVFPVVALEGGT